MTNRQVARQLGVSEATVRKHLENIYARLGVQNRAEAVSRTTSPTAPPRNRPRVPLLNR
jgi:DNA-binding CsgD family transcriptional regulator